MNKPYKEGYLPEREGHEIYFACYGNPDGPAIVSVHGGPGGRSKISHVECFDLSTYSVVLFDQRGCGKSTPLGEIENNTTELLALDMEALREYLEIERWYVSGASWGSTLALIYAESFPSRVKGLFLSSIWLAREQDVAWSLTSDVGAATFFPDVWSERLSFLERYGASPDNAAAVLLEHLQGGDVATSKDIVAGVVNWETNLFSVTSDVKYSISENIEEDDIAWAKVFLHYEANNLFLSENQILDNIEFIKDIPTVIIHGRYDVVCPVNQAWELKNNLNNVDFVIAPSSGHSLSVEARKIRNVMYTNALTRFER